MLPAPPKTVSGQCLGTKNGGCGDSFGPVCYGRSGLKVKIIWILSGFEVILVSLIVDFCGSKPTQQVVVGGGLLHLGTLLG